MRLIGYDEIVALLGALPNNPENGQVASMLQQLAKQSRIVRVPFSINANSGIVAPAGTSTINIAIDAAAPFLIVNQTYAANNAAAAQTSGTFIYPNWTVLLTDTGSNRQLMDVDTPITNIFGNGQFPYVLPEPKLMQANSILQCKFTSFEAAVSLSVRLTFSGYRLYSLS